FAGGCTLEAIEAVCNPNSDLAIDPLDGVSALVDKSLVRQEEAKGEPRFSMLATIREFGVERLQASGQAELIERAHATFYLSMAEEWEQASRRGDESLLFSRLDADIDNVRAALSWTLRHDTDAALRLCTALLMFWLTRGHIVEAREWIEQALALPD